MKQRTAMSLHQAQPGKYAFESCLTLATSPLTWIILTNLEDCLKGHSAAQALNSSYRVTSTISGRGPVRIVKALWRSTSWAQRSQPPLFHICPLCRLELYVAPAATHANWQRSFSELCGTARSCRPDGAQGYRQPCILWVQRFTRVDWGDIEQWVQAEHNAFFMCDKFEKPSGWSCSLRRDLIWMLLTRNSTTNIPNIMPAHGRL